MRGIQQFYRTLGSKFYLEDSTEVGLWAFGGEIQYTFNTSMVWYNGSTYAAGYERLATNNKVWALKQTGTLVEFSAVNNGTASPEPLNHPAPIILTDDDGYIYVIQNTFHVDPYEVWKSDSPEDISSFTSIGEFDTDGAYMGLLKKTNKECVFLVRSGSGGSGYNQSVLHVTLDNPTAYTKQQLTDADYGVTNVRHYNINPKFYGTSNYRVGGINHRLDSPVTNYKFTIWITQDFQTIENIGLTYSKDVTSSVLTAAELEANFTRFGTDAANTTIAIGSCIQINDDIYALNFDAAVDTTFNITKYTIGTAAPVATVSLPSGLGTFVYMYYNGEKIVMQFNFNSTRIEIWSVDLSLSSTTLKLRKALPTLDGDYLVGLPYNLPEVDNKYLIVGRGNPDGTVPYVITDDKFL